MRKVSIDTLKKVRSRLSVCIELMHDEANASAKEEAIHAIAMIDNMIESEDQDARAELLLKLIGKILEKLPWLVSLMRDVD